MLYGKAKERQMARSVLPSTARRSAAVDLAIIRRRGRHQSAGRLRVFVDCSPAVDLCNRWDEAADDERFWPQHEIKDAVWERRSGDKVAPLQRWAIARTRHLAPQDRLEAVRAVLPRDLIGRHALSHVRWLDEFGGHLEHTFVYRPRTPADRPRAARERLEEELARILTDGELKAFNAHMKKTTPFQPLAGAHDVEGFLDRCYGRRGSAWVLPDWAETWFARSTR